MKATYGGSLHSVEPEAHFYDRRGHVWYVDETPDGNVLVWSPETRPPCAPLHVRWAIDVVDADGCDEFGNGCGCRYCMAEGEAQRKFAAEWEAALGDFPPAPTGTTRGGGE